ncbi:sce7726 family protein [Schleiferilactobacillus shenzhenensis]|uniref:Sce7726 family protein n=1 Tax=Schleiferilactobacillus shenzhenensis LY-73 TaxID=1231336 RepID=U4TSX2_9LACO|nr:sce7726 family protein [Schleiferilactobacillus shenzhenensis]ERL64577.1 hypothetical protein L248_0761 [Schleiferilactobacillus shenzhenensis LY-73]
MGSVEEMLGRLFSPAGLKQIVNAHDTALVDEMRQRMAIAPSQSNNAVVELAYQTMSRQYRNEYFFKNTLLTKILLGRHSIHTSTALRELPVAGSILDFLIINGIGQVYEVKTGLDNFDRLPSQLASYYQAFKYVTVVTDDSHLPAATARLQGTDVGLVVLTRRNTLHTVWAPKPRTEQLTHEAMFKILRKGEYETILRAHFGKLPQVNQFQYYRACLAWFKKIDLETCHQELLAALKKRTTIQRHADQFQRVPQSLKELVYFADFQDADYAELDQVLQRIPQREASNHVFSVSSR